MKMRSFAIYTIQFCKEKVGCLIKLLQRTTKKFSIPKKGMGFTTTLQLKNDQKNPTEL